jgi:hypothetical protein
MQFSSGNTPLGVSWRTSATRWIHYCRKVHAQGGRYTGWVEYPSDEPASLAGKGLVDLAVGRNKQAVQPPEQANGATAGTSNNGARNKQTVQPPEQAKTVHGTSKRCSRRN